MSAVIRQGALPPRSGRCGTTSTQAAVSWRVLARHQLASGVATTADFALMTSLVEFFALAPATAALSGAVLGALINFTLNRRYTFRTVAQSPAGAEARRYVLVSSASALLNSGGEYIGTKWLSAPYLLVRVVVSVAVSLGWNFPLHRSWVFQSAASPPRERRAS
jgi:putative flippase GtrA